MSACCENNSAVQSTNERTLALRCRWGGYLSADINGGSAPGFSSGQAQDAIQRIAAETLPKGISFEWTELTYQEILAGNSALLVFPLAILMIVPMGLLAAMTGVWLAVLVGDAASSFHLQSLDSPDWQAALPTIPSGVPSTVLARRPDVAAAQSSLLAAQARVGVAQAAWFPDVSLTAAGGYASSSLSDVFKWSARAWGVGALLSLPIFDGGRREAGVKSASAQLDGATAQYRGQVLNALREVEDQLAALRLLAQQTEAQDRAVASATRATKLSDVRYRNGLVSQLDLLDARRSELRNRRQALDVRSSQYQSTVLLIRALGGGWDVAEQAKAVAAPQVVATKAVAGG